jgi:hypothetical protein
MAATALPHSTSSSVIRHIQQPLFLIAALSMLCSRNGLFMPHQQAVVIHLTTPTTLPAKQWQSRLASRNPDKRRSQSTEIHSAH